MKIVRLLIIYNIQCYSCGRGRWRIVYFVSSKFRLSDSEHHSLAARSMISPALRDHSTHQHVLSFNHHAYLYNKTSYIKNLSITLSWIPQRILSIILALSLCSVPASFIFVFGLLQIPILCYPFRNPLVFAHHTLWVFCTLHFSCFTILAYNLIMYLFCRRLIQQISL